MSVSFSTWQFAVAGAVCAAGPVIIHLLNRRRYRVVHWAAMDFLRSALKRNRKILQIRDLILLALRTLAVLLSAERQRTSRAVVWNGRSSKRIHRRDFAIPR